MKMSEMIAAVGDDIVQIQNLDACSISMNWSAKRGTKITFGTEMKIASTGRTERLGMIVWLPRDRVSEVIKTAPTTEQKP